MKGFRFLHAADLHLDSPFKGLSEPPPAIARVIRDAALSALDRLVQTALEEQVDFVLIAGDVYDLRDRSLRAELRFLQAVERLQEAGIGVYVVHGNHDPLDGRRAALKWPDNVYFFAADQVESIIAHSRDGHPVARIHGISYPTASVTRPLAPLFQAVDEPLYQIGLLHCNVDANRAHANYAPCSLEDLLRTRMDYWALGHVHERRILHCEPWVVYPGNMQGRHIRETGPRGCYLVNVDENRNTKLDFRPLDAVRWHEITIDISALDSEQQLYDHAASAMEKARQDSDLGAILRIVWTGRGPLSDLIRREEVRDELLQSLREAETYANGCEETWNHDSPVAAASGRGGRWVWLLPFQVETGDHRELSDWYGKNGFIGDLAQLVQELETDEEKLQAFVEKALEPLLINRRVAKYVEKALEEERVRLLQLAGDLALHLLLEDRKMNS
mgnify:CR=1 FL=1